MAIIQKKGNHYYVVYYTSINSEEKKKRKWIKCETYQQALEIKETQNRYEYKGRNILNVDQIKKILYVCDDPLLILATTLAFSASLRVGEILGLTWDNVHISNDDIEKDNAHINIVKQLQRVNAAVLDIALKNETMITVLPPLHPNSKTSLVLKKYKTKSSQRTIWLPKSLAYLLKNWKKKQLETKMDLGPDIYQDNNLVIANEYGAPVLSGYINKNFKKLVKKSGLPSNYVFHSLRHSSATYKLMLNNGDIKSTQGDTGLEQAKMITDIYSHLLDEHRKERIHDLNQNLIDSPDLLDVLLMLIRQKNLK